MHFPWVVIFNTKVSILPLKCFKEYSRALIRRFFRFSFQTSAYIFSPNSIFWRYISFNSQTSVIPSNLYRRIFIFNLSRNCATSKLFFPFHFLIKHIPLFYCCLLSVTSRTWKTFPFQTHHSTLQVGVCSSTFNPLASNDFSLLVLSDVDAESLYAPGMLLQSVYPLDSVQ